MYFKSPASLGDVRQDRERRSAWLSTDHTGIRARELAHEAIQRHRKLTRLLPDLKLPEIMHATKLLDAARLTVPSECVHHLAAAQQLRRFVTAWMQFGVPHIWCYPTTAVVLAERYRVRSRTVSWCTSSSSPWAPL
jgi:hypothetical protein